MRGQASDDVQVAGLLALVVDEQDRLRRDTRRLHGQQCQPGMLGARHVSDVLASGVEGVAKRRPGCDRDAEVDRAEVLGQLPGQIGPRACPRTSMRLSWRDNAEVARSDSVDSDVGAGVASCAAIVALACSIRLPVRLS